MISSRMRVREPPRNLVLLKQLVVATATAARFNMLRMFTLRVREPALQPGVAKAIGCGYGHHCVV
jgi:hypothetical protein